MLAAAANRGITLRYGEQPDPIRHDAGNSIHASERMLAAGVPIDFARDAIYTYAQELTLERPPRTLKYFVDHVIDRWKAKQEHATAANSDARPLTAPSATNRTIPSAAALEQRAADERRQEQRDAAEFKGRQRRALQWTKDHPEEYEQLRAEIERGYAGLPSNDFTRKAIEVELVSKCADRADQNSGRISEAVR